MTALLDRALAAARTLPPAAQDDIARVVRRLAGTDDEASPVALSPDEQAAIAVAIVSAKPPAHFRGSPGGYFHGMVSKAKAGELHLARTIWGMRGSGEHQLK